MSEIPRLFMGRGVESMGPAGWPDGVGVLAWNGRKRCGMDALLGSRTATLFWVVFLPPVGFLHGVLPCGVLAARWWLENWIVDASGWLAFLAGCLLYCFVRAYFFGGFGSIVL
ncbi:hypothetical protein [Bifidobacterium sp. ESL0820]|uniref:hypothetical protein n=2 Tax=Bifidobacterium sp. ESL0820 TaxID=3448586 RepID=UPI0040424AD3